MYLENSPNYFQLTKEYHDIKDKALEICPEYAIVYKHKSTAYLKTGDFIGWKKLIDKAVELNPKENLDYRGWCRFQFFRDYEGAIKDIEALDKLVNHDIGFCQNGHYHLNIAKALCYKMLGQESHAIQIIEAQLTNDISSLGLYDYLHLGVLYLDQGNYSKAIENFKKQHQQNELTENYYYLALAYKQTKDFDAYKSMLAKAKQLYLEARIMQDIYTHHVDKIYLKDIENEIDRG